MKKASIFICTIILLSLFPGCSKQPETLSGIITFIHGNLKINSQDAYAGSRVQKGDILLTGDKSFAVIQIAQTSVITLQSGAELKFDNLSVNQDESHTVILNLTKGSTFHKVIRQGSDYSVKTPTVVASVRGTSFEVKVEDKNSSVSLLNGKVKVTTLAGEVKEAELAPGQYLDADADKFGEISILREDETNRLSQIDTISAVPDIEKVIPEKKEINGTETKGDEVVPEPVKKYLLMTDSENTDIKTSAPKNNYIPDTASVKKLINKENRTIEDIKAVFRRVDEIRLFSGRVIQGAITERGERYTVITTTGVMKFSEGEIQTVRVIR